MSFASRAQTYKQSPIPTPRFNYMHRIEFPYSIRHGMIIPQPLLMVDKWYVYHNFMQARGSDLKLTVPEIISFKAQSYNTKDTHSYI